MTDTKKKLSVVDYSAKDFEDYFNNLFWFPSFIEKYRVRKYLRKTKAQIDVVKDGVARLNKAEEISRDAFLNSIVAQHNEYAERAKALAKQSKPFVTEFEVAQPGAAPGKLKTFATQDASGHATVATTAQLRQMVRNVAEFDALDEEIKTLKKWYKNIEAGNILAVPATNGVTDAAWQHSGNIDPISTETIIDDTDSLRPVNTWQSKYLLVEDEWSVEDSAVLYRALAYLSSHISVVIPLDLYRTVYGNPQGVEVRPIDGSDFVIVKIDLAQAQSALTNRRVEAEKSNADKIADRHLKVVRKIAKQLEIRAVSDANPANPNRIQIRYPSFQNNNWLDITDAVTSDEDIKAKGNQLFAMNDSEIRVELLEQQDKNKALSFGKTSAGNPYPLTDNTLVTFLKNELGADFPSVDNSSGLGVIIFANKALDALIAEQEALVTERKPWSFNVFKRGLLEECTKREALIAKLKELKAYRDRLAASNIAVGSEFYNYCMQKKALRTSKSAYNRFTHVDNRLLFRLLEQNEIALYKLEKNIEETQQLEPTNWFSKLFRSSHIKKLCETRKEQLLKTKSELEQQREAIAEEMYVRVNKYVLTSDLPHELYEDYKSCINEFASPEIKEKFEKRTNFKAHLITMLAEHGVNLATKAASTKYVDELIRVARQKEPVNNIEIESLQILKNIFTGVQFDVSAVTDHHKNYLISFINPAIENNPQSKKACQSLYNVLQRQGLNIELFLEYLAVTFTSHHLTNAYGPEGVLVGDNEIAKIKTYAELLDKYATDRNQTRATLGKYRNNAEQGLVYFGQYLVEQKFDVRKPPAESEFKKHFKPIITIPAKVQEGVKQYKDLLQEYVNTYVGTGVAELTENYKVELFQDGKYKGDNFTLSGMLQTIALSASLATYVEKRLYNIFETSIADANSKGINHLMRIYLLPDEEGFLTANCKNPVIQVAIDRVALHWYKKLGWSQALQEFIDNYCGQELRERIRVNHIRELIEHANKPENKGTDDICLQNTEHKKYIEYLKGRGIDHTNFATGKHLDQFNHYIQESIESNAYRWTMTLEESIFAFAEIPQDKSSARDGIVGKKVKALISEGNKSHINSYQQLWDRRLDNKSSQNNCYALHLPKQAEVDNNSNSDGFVAKRVVSKYYQADLDKLFLAHVFVNSDVLQPYANHYNPNVEELAGYASQGVVRELRLQCLNEYLQFEEKGSVVESQGRYLALDEDDLHNLEGEIPHGISAYSDEQVSRHIRFNSLLDHVNRDPNSLVANQTKPVLLEQLVFSGLKPDNADTYLPKLREVGKEQIARTTYGLTSIDNLKQYYGESRLKRVAQLFEHAVANIKESTVGKIQVIRILSWCLTPALVSYIQSNSNAPANVANANNNVVEPIASAAPVAESGIRQAYTDLNVVLENQAKEKTMVIKLREVQVLLDHYQYDKVGTELQHARNLITVKQGLGQQAEVNELLDLLRNIEKLVIAHAAEFRNEETQAQIDAAFNNLFNSDLFHKNENPEANKLLTSGSKQIIIDLYNHNTAINEWLSGIRAEIADFSKQKLTVFSTKVINEETVKLIRYFTNEEKQTLARSLRGLLSQDSPRLVLTQPVLLTVQALINILEGKKESEQADAATVKNYGIAFKALKCLQKIAADADVNDGECLTSGEVSQFKNSPFNGCAKFINNFVTDINRYQTIKYVPALNIVVDTLGDDTQKKAKTMNIVNRVVKKDFDGTISQLTAADLQLIAPQLSPEIIAALHKKCLDKLADIAKSANHAADFDALVKLATHLSDLIAVLEPRLVENYVCESINNLIRYYKVANGNKGEAVVKLLKDLAEFKQVDWELDVFNGCKSYSKSAVEKLVKLFTDKLSFCQNVQSYIADQALIKELVAKAYHALTNVWLKEGFAYNGSSVSAPDTELPIALYRLVSALGNEEQKTQLAALRDKYYQFYQDVRYQKIDKSTVASRFDSFGYQYFPTLFAVIGNEEQQVFAVGRLESTTDKTITDAYKNVAKKYLKDAYKVAAEKAKRVLVPASPDRLSPASSSSSVASAQGASALPVRPSSQPAHVESPSRQIGIPVRSVSTDVPASYAGMERATMFGSNPGSADRSRLDQHDKTRHQPELNAQARSPAPGFGVQNDA